MKNEFKARLGHVEINGEQKEMIKQILDSNWVTEGEFTRKFEEKIAEFVGTKYAIACGNGTLALMLANEAIIPRDTNKRNGEIWTSALTFPATVNSILTTGYKPRLFDAKKDLQIDENLLWDAVNRIKNSDHPKIKEMPVAIMPVHLMGYSANMTEIMKIAKEAGAYVIEDACESFGALHNGKRVGSFGDVGCFSFYASHNIQGGELGAVTTNDKELYEKMKSIKNHGRTADSLKFRHDYVGFNFKTTEFTSALALANMRKAEDILKKRYEAAKYLHDEINNEKITKGVITTDSTYLGYPMGVAKEYQGILSREKIIEKLNAAGVETREMFPNIANQGAFRHMFEPGEFPMASMFEKQWFYVGAHQYLTQEQLDIIVKAINSI